jgi:hypothetical protein
VCAPHSAGHSGQPVSSHRFCMFLFNQRKKALEHLIREKDYVTNELGSLKNNIAYIEFSTDGEIRHANKIFLDLMGYTLPRL